MIQERRRRIFHEKKFPYMPEFSVMVRRDLGIVPSSVLAYHREWEFQLILKGRGFYSIAGEIYLFRPNTVFAIAPNRTHYYMTTPEDKIEKWKLIFLPHVLRGLKLAGILSSIPCRVSLTEKEAAAMVLLFHSLNEELNLKEEFWKKLALCRICELIWLLKRAGKRTLPRPVETPLARQITEYIDLNFARRLSIPELAARFGYSPGHLSHIFKQHTQFGIKHYLLQRRIAEARRQLEENPGIKVNAVAGSVGFENFGVFNRMFKLLIGVTPAVYRRNSHPDRRI